MCVLGFRKMTCFNYEKINHNHNHYYVIAEAHLITTIYDQIYEKFLCSTLITVKMFIRSIILFLFLFVAIHESKTIGQFPSSMVKNKRTEGHNRPRNGNELHFDNQTIRSLRVSSSNFEPFMYQDKDGQFYNGIEYKLSKTIAEKFHLNLSFKTHFRRSDYNPLILK